MGIFYHVVLARSAGHIPQIIYSIFILFKKKKKYSLLYGKRVLKQNLRTAEHPVLLVSNPTSRSSSALPEDITFSSV